MKTHRRALLVSSALLLLTACKQEHIALQNSLASFKVTVLSVTGAAGGDGTAANPYATSQGDVTLIFDAEAIDQRGQLLTDFNGDVGLRVTPGELVNTIERVTFSGGKVQDASIRVRKLVGRVTLWLEDVRWQNGDVAAREGARSLQLKYPEGSFAAGASNTIHFSHPTLAYMQHSSWLEQNSNIDDSVLAGSFVEIDCRQGAATGPWQDGHGQLVVTGIFNEGFYVTDLASPGTSYNHLYVYSYSYPEFLDVGDRLERLVGTAQDFSGCTQVSFPAWSRALDAALDPLPFRVTDLDAVVPPTLVTSAMCNVSATSNKHLCGHSKYNWTMEALESARVRLENLRTPDVWINCDFNGDLEIVPDWLDASDPEAVCSVSCLTRDGKTEFAVKEIIGDLVTLGPVVCPWEAQIPNIPENCQKVMIGAGHVCSELTTMRQFGQWVVALDDGAGPLINLITSESLVGYDPTAWGNLGQTLEFVQGNLRQVRAARPRWMVLVGRGLQDAPPEMQPRIHLTGNEE